MKPARAALLTFVSLLVPAFAQTDGRKDHEQVCIFPGNIRNTTIVDDRTILFHMKNGRVWKNTLRRKCHGLKFENGFSWEIHGGRICSGRQVIRVVNTGTPCFLGAFTRFEEAKDTAEKDEN